MIRILTYALILTGLLVCLNCKTHPNGKKVEPKESESVTKVQTNKDSNKINLTDTSLKSEETKTYGLNDSIKIVLDKNAKGGYEWFMEKNDTVELIAERDSIYKNSQIRMNEHAKIFIIKPIFSGETTIRFSKKRGFEPDSLAIKNAYTKKIIIK